MDTPQYELNHTSNDLLFSLDRPAARDRHLSYISSKYAGNSGTNRTTQAEISNLLRLSFRDGSKTENLQL